MLGGQGRSGRWFPERGCILEHKKSSGLLKMFLCDRCSTWPGLTFSWQAQYFKQMEWKNRKTKRIGTRSLCIQFSIFEGGLAQLLRFWCRQLGNWGSLSELLRFWHCQLQKLRISQNCCVVDVVNLKNWGSLAELLCCWCCQVQELRKSRRIASFSSLQVNR